MNQKVKSVEPLAEFKLKLFFANGEVRIFDVTPVNHQWRVFHRVGLRC
jgi:hypothetical protein